MDRDFRKESSPGVSGNVAGAISTSKFRYLFQQEVCFLVLNCGCFVKVRFVKAQGEVSATFSTARWQNGLSNIWLFGGGDPARFQKLSSPAKSDAGNKVDGVTFLPQAS